MNYQASIITPVFNKFSYTKAYLKDVLSLNAEKVEIIIIDNASTDETLQGLNEYAGRYPNLKILTNTINLGFGKASNQAYEQATGENIIFLNNDVRVKERYQWIDLLLAQCQDNQLVSPTGGFVDPKADFKFCYETRDPGTPINYLSGWCLAGKKEVFNQLLVPGNTYRGPFDETFNFYFEDTDLSFRAAAAKIKLVLQDIPVIHFGKISSRQLNISDLYLTAKEVFSKKWSK